MRPTFTIPPRLGVGAVSVLEDFCKGTEGCLQGVMSHFAAALNWKKRGGHKRGLGKVGGNEPLFIGPRGKTPRLGRRVNLNFARARVNQGRGPLS